MRYHLLKLPLNIKILLGQAFFLLPLVVTLSLHFQGFENGHSKALIELYHLS